MNEILLNIESKERRLALLKSGRLFDLHIERKSSRQMSGNIYKGKVMNILRNIQSAFIAIGESENGFIHISDIIENSQKLAQMYDMDFDLDYDINTIDPRRPNSIDEVLNIDQQVLVQVVKEPIGSKGARLTSNVSVAGRYLVLLPNTPHRGVSRKIEDRAVRDRLKRLIRAFEMPQEMGLICRTASANASADDLIAEASELLENWNQIVEGFRNAPGPQLLHRESDLVKRAVITAVDKRLDRMLIDDFSTFQACQTIYAKYSKEHDLRIEYYRDKMPIFERFGVEREFEKTLLRKIWLPSGGYLYFDRTEAMCTIDVNSGRSTSSENNVEESLVRINLEAAEELSRQLRLRNIGGLIIVDFIDMRLRKSKKRVLDMLKDCMKEDNAKCSILNMSEFGLVEMTRQRNRESVMQTMLCECPYCSGCGTVKTHESVSIEIERAIRKCIRVHQHYGLRIICHPQLLTYIKQHDADFLEDMSERLNSRVDFGSDDNLHINTFEVYSSTNMEKIEL